MTRAVTVVVDMLRPSPIRTKDHVATNGTDDTNTQQNSAQKSHVVTDVMSSLLSSRAESHAVTDTTLPSGHSMVSDPEDAISQSGSMPNDLDVAIETISLPNLSPGNHVGIVRTNR